MKYSAAAAVAGSMDARRTRVSVIAMQRGKANRNVRGLE